MPSPDQAILPLQRALPGLLAVFFACGLAACAKRATSVEQGNRDQVIHIGNLGEPNDLDPAYPDTA